MSRNKTEEAVTVVYFMQWSLETGKRQDLNRTAKICSGKLTNTMVHLTRARIFLDCFGASVQSLFFGPMLPISLAFQTFAYERTRRTLF